MVLCKSSTFKFSWAHADCFILHFMAELATLMPSQNYSMLFETRATRSIYHVYSVYLPIVTVQYSEASHEWQEVPIHQGNVTTCHIGINAKLFHEPPPHTWALNHYICLAVLMRVMLSGRLNFTLHWSANTNSYLCPLFWVTKCHVECGNNLLQ